MTLSGGKRLGAFALVALASAWPAAALRAQDEAGGEAGGEAQDEQTAEQTAEETAEQTAGATAEETAQETAEASTDEPATEDGDGPAEDADEPPRPTRQTFYDGLRFGAGPRAGITINTDQWAVGGYGRLDGICLIGCSTKLGIGLHLLATLGGNYMTVRGSLRLEYPFFITDDFAIYPAVGASAFYYFPVGDFARFCNETDLDECDGFEGGYELGGGLRIYWLSVEALAGLGDIPVVTITLAVHFPLWDSREDG